MSTFNLSFSKQQGKQEKIRLHHVNEFTALVADATKAEVERNEFIRVKKLAASMQLDAYNTEKFVGSGSKKEWIAQKLAEAERNLQGYNTNEEVLQSKEYALLSSKNKMFEACRNFLACKWVQTEEAAKAAKEAAAKAKEAKQAAKQAKAEADAAKEAAAEAAKNATTEEKAAYKEAKQAEAKQAEAKAEAAAKQAEEAEADAVAKANKGKLMFAKEIVIGYRINSLSEEEKEKYANSVAWKEITIQVGTEFADTLQYYVNAGYNIDFSEVCKQRKKAFTKAEVSSKFWLKNDKLYTMQLHDIIDYDTLFAVLSFAVQEAKAKEKAAAASKEAKEKTLQGIKEAEAAKKQEYLFIVANIANTMQMEEAKINISALTKQVQEAESIRLNFDIKEEKAEAVQKAEEFLQAKKEAAKQAKAAKKAAKEAEAKKQAEADAASKEADAK